MLDMLFPNRPEGRPPVIGMVHLAPLPDAPGYDGDLERVRRRALRDAEALAEGGVDALMLENFGDAPFYPGRVPAHVVAHMSVIAARVRQAFDLPLGINCLRNDALSALAIAHAAGGGFIRVNILTGARVTDQGLVQGQAHDLLRERERLRAHAIRILADVDVKHSTALGAARPLAEEVTDLIRRGLADGVIVSGGGTGLPTDRGQVRAVKHAAGGTPVFIGSGVTPGMAREYARLCDGLIVGTALKRAGSAGNAVDARRVRELMAAL
ncbi:MAG: BtpA/SgcQ family protein [Candidatus Sedimenticola endophacoides]